jgi:cytochrome P450
MTQPTPLPRLPDHLWNPATSMHFDEELDSWCVFGYRDVHRVINDVDSLSAAYGIDVDDLSRHRPETAGMWAADGQRHHDLRALTKDVFRPISLQKLADSIRHTVRVLVDQAIADAIASGTGRVEAVEAFGRPLPSRVITDLLDLDYSWAERMHLWTDEVDECNTMTTLLPQEDQAEALLNLVRERRAAPGHGLVDDLIAAQTAGYTVDGRPFSDWDLIGYIALLLSGGIDATNTAITNALLYLSEYGYWELLGERPELIPAAAEEVLRWYPPFPGVRRLVVQPIEFEAGSVPAGESVTGWIPSANRDPRVFPDPDTFDIRREPNRHLSFGMGSAHYCIGAPLSRLELRIALEEMTRRLPGLQRDPEVQLQRRPSLIIPALKEARFTFDVEAAQRARDRVPAPAS